MPWALNEHPSSVVSIFTSFMPGYRLVDGEDLLTMGNLLFSSQDAIDAGSSQQNAVPLDTFISQVTDGNTVVLPPGLPGRYLFVMNDSPNELQVYGSTYNLLTGTPDTVAGSASSTQSIMANQAAGTAAEYMCFAPGMWKQVTGAAVGPGGGIPDAPINGVTYGRFNGAWVPVLNLSGGTMTGPLILAPGVPSNPNQAVSLNYVNNLTIDEGTY
jgi:hypothetical protein